MRLLLPLAIATFLSVPLTAQNFVTNGDFENGLTGWTETGFSVQPGLELFDTTGLGASNAYGAGHGGQVTPSPYPPNTIKTSITAIPGVPLEFSMDICVQRSAAGGNADAGTFWVEIGGVEVARVRFGSYVSLEFARARLTSRFTLVSGGVVDLEIFMHRTFLANANTPKARIDNVQLQIASGPTFIFEAQRRLGATRNIGGSGVPNSPFAFFLSGNRTNGIMVPGIQGTLFLDLASLTPFFSGTFDGQGRSSFALTIPNDPGLTLAPIYVQGVHVAGGSLVLGFDQALQFNP